MINLCFFLNSNLIIYLMYVLFYNYINVLILFLYIELQRI